MSQPIELTGLRRLSVPPPGERAKLERRARQLAWGGIAWHVVEFGIATGVGIAAGSIALTGFGATPSSRASPGSSMSGASPARGSTRRQAEARAQRIVAIQFFILAPYVAYEAISKLWHGDQPDASWIGIALVAVERDRDAAARPCEAQPRPQARLRRTHGEGTQNILCGYLAVAVLIGLLGNALLGWWWLDPIAALAIAGLAVREGLESWRGESCGCATC